MSSVIDKFKSSVKFRVISILLLILYITLILLCTIKIDKQVITPGVLNNPSSFLTIEGKEFGPSYDQGNVNTIGVYVTYQPTIFQYLISSPNNFIEISDYSTNSDLSPNDQYLRGKFMKDLSIDNSLITAYKKAMLIDNEISISYQFEGLLVTANIPGAYSKDIKIGDIITGVIVDNITYSLSDAADENYIAYLKEKISGCYVEGNQKEFTFIVNEGTQIPFKWNDKGSLFLELYPKYKITSSVPTYRIDQDTIYDSIGSSGGMMLALTIYNSLIEEDVTKGLMICGTGTVDNLGQIGAIGGIKQKIVTSQLYKADIFFAPYSEDETSGEYQNYQDALEQYNKIKNPTFKLVKVSSLDDILKYLEGIGE